MMHPIGSDIKQVKPLAGLARKEEKQARLDERPQFLVENPNKTLVQQAMIENRWLA
jgi:hypothetical protein